MNNYTNFEVRDWLEDEAFRGYVYRGKAAAFWADFRLNNPLQVANMDQAQEILLSVRGELDPISESEVQGQVNAILDAIPEGKTIPWWKGNWLRVAAMLVLAVGIGFLAARKLNHVSSILVVAKQNAEPVRKLTVVNKSSSIRLVNLPDGSSVVLKSNARITYPEAFAPERREVTMSGEAFFEVVKNPAQPFFVYAGNMVSKVKGTSFSIAANEGDDEVKLVVKTGLVEVSANPEKTSIQNKKLLLKPNEQVTFSQKTQSMRTHTVAKPALIDLPVESQTFEFKRTPLSDVFISLEKTYGVKINFDPGAISHCTLTATLGDEPVSEKLDMICAVVNARYETQRGVVSIVSAGCE